MTRGTLLDWVNKKKPWLPQEVHKNEYDPHFTALLFHHKMKILANITNKIITCIFYYSLVLTHIPYFLLQFTTFFLPNINWLSMMKNFLWIICVCVCVHVMHNGIPFCLTLQRSHWQERNNDGHLYLLWLLQKWKNSTWGKCQSNKFDMPGNIDLMCFVKFFTSTQIQPMT